MFTNIIEKINQKEMDRISAERRALPDFNPGDVIRVNVRIREGDRFRIQAYEGVCIACRGSGINKSFVVRKISFGEGVERVFPYASPMIESVELVRRGRVRRAKLYYLRNLRGKAARIRELTTARPTSSPTVKES